MFHKKRFRSTIAIILTLLLIAAVAPVASAQDPPGPGGPTDTPEPTPAPPGPGGPSPTPDPTDPVGPTPPSTPEPPTDPDPPDPPGPNGNGDMMSMPSSHSWPPPNAVVMHAATPVQISSHGGALNVYFIVPGGDAVSGPALPSISSLGEMHMMGGAVSLFSGTNPGTGKSVEIVYLPDEMKIRVSTYYADKPPHDYNKPYVFTVDADHSVNHERW